jgi:hypothetical protein
MLALQYVYNAVLTSSKQATGIEDCGLIVKVLSRNSPAGTAGNDGAS